jgi:hypothetical protein
MPDMTMTMAVTSGKVAGRSQPKCTGSVCRGIIQKSSTMPKTATTTPDRRLSVIGFFLV